VAKVKKRIPDKKSYIEEQRRKRDRGREGERINEEVQEKKENKR